MFRVIGLLVFLVMLASCSTVRNQMGTSVSMLAWNSAGHAFVSKDLAVKLADLFMSEKYPKDVFIGSGQLEVEDADELWIVRQKNSLAESMNADELPMIDGAIVPRVVVIKISKATGEVVELL